jgi:hypothetical protein
MERRVREMLDRMRDDLRRHPLDFLHMKLQIAAGLTLCAFGLIALVQTQAIPPVARLAGIAMFVVGGGVAFSGHRKELHQNNADLAAWVAVRLQDFEQSKTSEAIKEIR